MQGDNLLELTRVLHHERAPTPRLPGRPGLRQRLGATLVRWGEALSPELPPRPRTTGPS